MHKKLECLIFKVWTFPVVEKILGRMDDVILTPDGRKVGRLSPVLKGFPIKEAQFVQEKIHSITVLLVKDTGYVNSTDISVCNELRKRLGNQIDIKIEHVSKISYGSGGKLRSVISKI